MTQSSVKVLVQDQSFGSYKEVIRFFADIRPCPQIQTIQAETDEQFFNAVFDVSPQGAQMMKFLEDVRTRDDVIQELNHIWGCKLPMQAQCFWQAITPVDTGATIKKARTARLLWNTVYSTLKEDNLFINYFESSTDGEDDAYRRGNLDGYLEKGHRGENSRGYGRGYADGSSERIERDRDRS